MIFKMDIGHWTYEGKEVYSRPNSSMISWHGDQYDKWDEKWDKHDASRWQHQFLSGQWWVRRVHAGPYMKAWA